VTVGFWRTTLLHVVTYLCTQITVDAINAVHCSAHVPDTSIKSFYIQAFNFFLGNKVLTADCLPPVLHSYIWCVNFSVYDESQFHYHEQTEGWITKFTVCRSRGHNSRTTVVINSFTFSSFVAVRDDDLELRFPLQGTRGFPWTGIFLFTTASRTVLGPTQPPLQWIPGALSLEVKLQRREADHSPLSGAEVKEWVALYLHSPNTPSCRSA
jgi:hypothetical protein